MLALDPQRDLRPGSWEAFPSLMGVFAHSLGRLSTVFICPPAFFHPPYSGSRCGGRIERAGQIESHYMFAFRRMHRPRDDDGFGFRLSRGCFC